MEQKKMKIRITGEYQEAEDSWKKVEYEQECVSLFCVAGDSDTAHAECLGGWNTAMISRLLQIMQDAFGRERFRKALAGFTLMQALAPDGGESMPTGIAEEEQENERKAAAACWGEDNDGE